MDNFGERLRTIRKLRGIKSNVLCNMLDVASGTVSRWETNNRNPGFETLKKIAVILNTSVAYLLAETNDPNPHGWQGSLNYNDKKIEEKSNVRLGVKFLEIPIMPMATAASCGAGNGLYGVIPESTENIFVEASTFTCLDDTRKPFAVPVEGDSMIGAGLEEGAFAVINPAEDVINGDTALICYNNNWLIKWVIYNPDGSVDLKPANPNYSPMHIESAYASDPSWF